MTDNQTGSAGVTVENGRKPTIFVQFSDCGQHIRKWSLEQFDGGQEYAMVTRNWVCTVDGEHDVDPTCVIDDHRYEDCIYAKPGMCREDCKYWQHLPTPPEAV